MLAGVVLARGFPSLPCHMKYSPRPRRSWGQEEQRAASEAEPPPRWCASWRRTLPGLTTGRWWSASGRWRVDADHARLALVDDGVHRHGGLAGLAVADDQLALAARWGSGCRWLEARLHGLVHGLAVHDAGAMRSMAPRPADWMGPLPSMGCPGRPPRGPRSGAHGDVHDAARALDGVALLDWRAPRPAG